MKPSKQADERNDGHGVGARQFEDVAHFRPSHPLSIDKRSRQVGGDASQKIHLIAQISDQLPGRVASFLNQRMAPASAAADGTHRNPER